MNNLNNQISNGRVNILGPNSDVRFSMSDKIPVNSTNYSCRDAMTGNWYDTELSKAFFSGKNMQILQNGIRAGVYNKSNQQYVVGEQNMDELQIIMRGIFLQYAKNQPSGIAQQIQDLNKIVLDFSVNQVWGEAEGYMKYKRDASTMWTPMTMPIFSHTNDKQLELKKWF
jgi:hypothetical protein